MPFRIKWLSGLLRCARNDALELLLQRFLGVAGIQKIITCLFLLLFVFFEHLLVFAMTRDGKLPDLKSSTQEREGFPSLFFTEEEIGHIHETQQNHDNPDHPSLSGILYHDENHWTVWINGRVVRPENAHELGDFHIKKVTPQAVEFSRLSAEGKVLETFTLHPHQ